MQQLNKLYRNENLFSYAQVPRRRIPVGVASGGVVPTPEAIGDGAGVNRDTSVRSKILSHFVKGKISLSPMEIMLMIPGKLEHLESLLRLARQKKDSEAIENQVDGPMLDSNNDTDDNKHCDEGSQLAEPNGDEYEFGNTELEDLVLTKGPQQILQLILQGQVDDFMEEEITNADDYANWIKWVSNAEERKHAIFKSRSCAEVQVLLQIHQIDSSGPHNDCSG
ncbi:unnamed protein product [Sphagnum compactum]